MENPTPEPPSATPGASSSTPANFPAAPTPAVIDPKTERNWCMWCHLSALAGFVGVPFGNILGPLVIWQMKRHEIPAVDLHGKEAVNFHLSMLIYLIGGGILTFIGMFFCVGWLLIPVLACIPIAALIFTIIAGIKGNDGVFYRYPLTIRLIK